MSRMGLVFKTIFSLNGPPKSFTTSFLTSCIFYLQSLSMNTFGNWSISIARCVPSLHSTYIYFLSSMVYPSDAWWSFVSAFTHCAH